MLATQSLFAPKRFAVAVALAVLCSSSFAFASPGEEPAPPTTPSPPSLYLRFFAGPQARTWGYGLATWGGQLAVSGGWAVGPHTALGLELAAGYGRWTGASPPGRLDEVIDAHFALLADHYLRGARGWHAQLGAGLFVGGSTGGVSNGDNGNVPLTNDSVPAPIFIAGIGYDWTDVGIVVRGDVVPFLGRGPHMDPAGVVVAVTALRF